MCAHVRQGRLWSGPFVYSKIYFFLILRLLNTNPVHLLGAIVVQKFIKIQKIKNIVFSVLGQISLLHPGAIACAVAVNNHIAIVFN